LNAPGIKRLKLICDDPLSNFAFKFNLRRYTVDERAARAVRRAIAATNEAGGALRISTRPTLNRRLLLCASV
jgi:hypothetical protein